VAATRPVDAIMPRQWRRFTPRATQHPTTLPQTLDVGEGSPAPHLSPRNPCNDQLSPPTPQLIGRHAKATAGSSAANSGPMMAS
jgi:hypothetical protein